MKVGLQELRGFVGDLIFSLENKGSATVIGLIGNLGAGKTTLVQAAAEILEINENVLSPTYVIMKKYEINLPDFIHKNLIHIDAYRLESDEELINLNIKDEFNNPDNLILIEWADKVEKILPDEYIKIKFKIIDEENREIEVVNG
jgi:tRNA threonylcarbamoyladenosine biosynthesis protein TsaE